MGAVRILRGALLLRSCGDNDGVDGVVCRRPHPACWCPVQTSSRHARTDAQAFAPPSRTSEDGSARFPTDAGRAGARDAGGGYTHEQHKRNAVTIRSGCCTG